MTDIVANCLEREARVDQPLHTRVPQRMRPGTAHHDPRLVQVMAGTARNGFESQRPMRCEVAEKQMTISNFWAPMLQIGYDRLADHW